jgi:MYXO-CTERM domain-containing protein
VRNLLIGCAALFSVAQLCAASTCTSGTLASYLSLGSSGCTIGGETLYNFSILSGQTGATELSAASITITPSGGVYSPTLTFTTSQSASTNALLESFFTYDLSGASLVSSAITLSGSSETGDGGVTEIENFCAGGMFDSTGVGNCTGTAGSLLTLDGAQNSDYSGLGPVSFLNVTDDFTLSGGTIGSAAGGTFTNSFGAVPEPASIMFAGFGLALAAGAGLRRRRSFLQNATPVMKEQ